jgi:hypothetical protein
MQLYPTDSVCICLTLFPYRVANIRQVVDTDITSTRTSQCWYTCQVIKSVPVDREVYGVGIRPQALRDCGFESRRGHVWVFLMIVVACQVLVFATDWSLVQRSPTECGVIMWCLETLTMRKTRTTMGIEKSIESSNNCTGRIIKYQVVSSQVTLPQSESEKRNIVSQTLSMTENTCFYLEFQTVFRYGCL